MRMRGLVWGAGGGILLWALVVRGSLAPDLGIGRRYRRLGPSTPASWGRTSGSSGRCGVRLSHGPARRRSRRRSKLSAGRPSAEPLRAESTLAGVDREPSEAPPYSTRVVDALRLPDGFTETDVVAVEEPLEIRIGGEPVAVTMRTPGHDEELALGFCVTEGLEPVSARVPDDLAANAVEVEAGGFDPERLRRHFYTSSSCGVCGKGAIEAVQVSAPRVESSLEIAQDVVVSLPGRLREAQRAFAATGGLHATGLFDAAGELLCVREDVGRHNAMDKVVGWAFSEGELPLSSHALCVSGRLSFELVQKAAVAGCPVLVAVGAPSSLAVELASDRGVTLCGWVRDGRVTVYSEPWRIV